jgi:transposase, IS30 family
MERLTLEKRIRLETLLKYPVYDNFFKILSDNKKVSRISEMMGIHSSTIRREVVGRGFTYDSYSASKAHADFVKKVSYGNTHYTYTEDQKILILSMIKRYSVEKKWSLNSLLLRFKLELPDSIKLPSVETVYQWVYEDAKSGGTLYKCLHREHRKRKKKINCREAKITNKNSIHNRSVLVDSRDRVGDIEIDSIVGPSNSAGMLTATDRKSRLIMAKLVSNKSSDETLHKILVMLLKHKKIIKTITSDNGSEFAKHLEIAMQLNVLYYFADPYSSYQRGSNENANGIIRRFFPKGTDFSNVTEKELEQVIYLINNLPRKIHCGKTAHEVYYGINKKLISAKCRKIMVCAFRA